MGRHLSAAVGEVLADLGREGRSLARHSPAALALTARFVVDQVDRLEALCARPCPPGALDHGPANARALAVWVGCLDRLRLAGAAIPEENRRTA